MNKVIIDRVGYKKSLTAVVYSLFQGLKDDAVELLGESTKLARLGSSFYQRMLNEVKNTLAPQMVEIYMNSADAQAESFNLVVDSGDLEKDAAAWANEWSEKIAEGMAESTRDKMAVASHQTRGMEVEEAKTFVVAKLSGMFDMGRAERIGITETTRAINAGKADVIDRIKTEYGVNVIGIWRCLGDDPCVKHCLPLNGEPFEVWASEFPEGPPAHPNCMCEIDWTIVED